MLLQQFAQDFILGLQLLFQTGHLPRQLYHRAVCPAFEHGRTALEQLLLPGIEHSRLQLVFVTQIGYRHMLQQVPPQDGYLLFR